jgi:serine/threonine protein kinase
MRRSLGGRFFNNSFHQGILDDFPLNHRMSHALASHGVGALKNGLKLIQRNDVQLNPAVKAKPGGFAIVH